METTFELIIKYLNKDADKKDLELYNYKLDGSKIEVRYSFNPEYDWDLNYRDHETNEIDLLDYISFVCQL